MVYRLQREIRRLVEAVIFHTSFSLRELSVEPHTLPLPLSLRSFSNVSHLFLRVVLWEESITSKDPGEAEVNWQHRPHVKQNKKSKRISETWCSEQDQHYLKKKKSIQSRWAICWSLYLFVLLFMQDPPGGFSSQEKTVSLKKEPRLSLGITIAGGRDCRSRLPVYITSVQPVGCLHRDGTVKRGTKQHLVVCDF